MKRSTGSTNATSSVNSTHKSLPHFDSQTVKDLEFDLVRRLLLNHCHNPTIIARAQQVVPLAHSKDWHHFLHLTKEFLEIKRTGVPFPAVGCEEIGPDNKRLAVRDSVLDEAAFARLRLAISTMNEVLKSVHSMDYEFIPRLTALLDSIEPNTQLPKLIDEVFDAKGQVKSNASPKLIQIREAMIKLRRNINRNFSREVKKNLEKGWLADTKESFINNRRVLAIQSTHKRKVTGTVLGQSKNGTITFIEPASTVSLNFEMEMMQDDERKEILRILRQLTSKARQFLPQLRDYEWALIELDWLRAKAQLAVEMEADLPGLREDSSFHLIQAYHPILSLQNKAQQKHTEPQTIALNSKERMLVISGPNAGGKSIALKTVGLLQVMLQSGLLVPVHPNSEMGCFGAILTDIGDNQSIENQLSTYSYRLNRMKSFLSVADKRSLLLLDEFGTGSDPELGGALAEVFFEELYERNVYAVITTHYANIKTRAAQLPHAINGSMRFDQDSLAPLYKLDVGTPGSSFTFEVAQINGIEQKLIERAKSKLDRNKVKLDQLISDLQKEKNTLTRTTDRNLKKELELEQLRAELVRREQHIQERLDAQQAVSEEQNEALHRGRKMQQFVQRFDPGKKNQALVDDILKYVAVEQTKRLESEKAKKVKEQARASRTSKKRRPQHFTERIKVGSTVRLRNGGKERGTVILMQGTAVTVLFGAFKTKVKLEQLSWVAN
ncbi:MAG: DNA mismatch repair protein MutS [Bacteroidetes bacterium]|nr:DNA mismatch repair protein MutS [Bacteroidota bacterium]MDA1335697.1 DNA mismatch repair protein MutS [Bacteroidota bacterium]